jgi:hypothetical protein
MLIRGRLLVLAALVLLGPAAGADETSSADGSKAADSSGELICRKEEMLGTRLGAHRVCHTAHEWDEISRASQDKIMDIQQRAAQTGVPNN